ncbi:alpha/beta fold hydrolase [Scytonema sp. UIC 10036]|uniref:thioesterase II family protein n=1 Tax=Scytonema sp. UIC 10036 TaxID=2304196 RepID=UPI0012DA606C|nr:alpha/beta fold hydrolase [Scytonema sp. UIC 10036]MUG91838.1 alpha/beta fold hydrolase [Scytonema sp. UIC 10036]
MALTKYRKLAGGRIGLRQLRQSEHLQSIQLLCFPYVGGNSLAFNPLARYLPNNWDLWAVDPPGHGGAKGIVIENLEELIMEYIYHIPWDEFDCIVLFGHSLGGYIVHALATELPKYREASLLCAIICATKPYHKRSKLELYSRLDDAALLQKLVNLGGIPTDTANNAEIFEFFKEVIRSDFRLFETCNPPENLLTLPMLALGSLEDTFCPFPHIYDWQLYVKNCEVDCLPGNHFCLQTHPLELCNRIVSFVNCIAKS